MSTTSDAMSELREDLECDDEGLLCVDCPELEGCMEEVNE